MRRLISASIRWLGVPALAAALLLTLGGTGAQAAPALTAMPLTVTLSACPSGSGSSLLTWSGVAPPLGGQIYTDLVVNGQTKQPMLPANGTHNLTMMQPGAYVAALIQTIAGTPPQTLATVTVTATCPAAPRPACPGDCFAGKPAVTPHGTFATFTVTTNADTTGGVVVGTQADANGDPIGTTFVSKATSFAAKVPTKVEVFGLQAKTMYFFAVQAKDANGKVFLSHGTFTTLKRRVEVRFETIHIINDSDAGSEGDLTFWFRVNGGPPKEIEAEAESGETVGTPIPKQVPLATFVINDAPATTTLEVSGCDDDEPSFPISTNYCIGFSQVTGQNDVTAYSYVKDAFDHSKKTGLDETHSVIFALTTPGPATLAFTVHGIYHVTYV